MQNKNRSQAGFSIIEVLIALSVLMLILAVGVPAANQIRNDNRAGAIFNTLDRLREACERHHADTGKMAVEFSPTHNGESYSAPRYHTLSIASRHAGWKGPYLARPLTVADNPFGGPVYLQNNLSSSPANGFHLAGAAGPKTEGPGQFVVFYGVPEEIAKQIDQRLDAGIGEREEWRSTGRVEWTQGGSGGLVIFLMGQNQ